jgi:hypothetical protein
VYATTATINPAKGWRQAGAERRALAILVLPVAGGLIFATSGSSGSGGFGAHAGGLGGLVLQLVLIPMLHALARVLRPYRSAVPPREAVVRHWLAATAMALGPVSFAMFATQSALGGALTVLAAVIAAPLGFVTVIWGLGFASERASQPRRPAPSGSGAAGLAA